MNTSNDAALAPADLQELDVADLHELGLWPPGKPFLVEYRLSSLMLVHASDDCEAQSKAIAMLQALVEKAGASGIPAREAARVRLMDADVELVSVERSRGGP